MLISRILIQQPDTDFKKQNQPNETTLSISSQVRFEGYFDLIFKLKLFLQHLALLTHTMSSTWHATQE